MHNVYMHILLIKTKFVALVIVKVILHNLLLQDLFTRNIGVGHDYCIIVHHYS